MATRKRKSARLVNKAKKQEKTFLADRMLGRLAKWLRILGYDTIYPEVVDDEKLAQICMKEGRILLSRDRYFKGRDDIRTLHVKDDRVLRQLRQVAREFNLSTKLSLLARCSSCNGVLKEVSRRSAKNFVPEHVYFKHERFVKCRKCEKFYWEGSHWKKMGTMVDKIK